MMKIFDNYDFPYCEETIRMNEKKHVKGYVSWAGNNKYKGKTLYSFRLKNEDVFFGCGLANPSVNKNDYIEFDYEVENGQYKVIMDSLSRIDLNAPSSLPSSSDSSNQKSWSGKTEGKDEYWSNKEARDLENDKYKRENDLRIQYQSARNAAIELVDILLREKALKLPEKQDGKYDAIMGKVEDLTNDLFARTSATPQLSAASVGEATGGIG